MPIKNKTIGVIGGMGPMATADLFRKLVELDAGITDQEHIRILVDSDTNIPDRASAIYGEGESPVSEMVRCALRLEQGGADVLIMGCNTAHYFYPDILPFVTVPFLSILDETCKAIKYQKFKKVGLLACNSTMRFGVYTKALDKHGIPFVKVDSETQEDVNTIIYDGVKAGNYSLDSSCMNRAVQELCEMGAEALVLGCTELPVAFEQFCIPSPVPLIDPTAEIAKSALRFVGAKIKGKDE